jgi:ATP-dependent exoDNAse (exonuclease V) alpha subunit
MMTWYYLQPVSCSEGRGCLMAIFYYKLKIISRGKGYSAISAAAYRACEKLCNPYDGRIADYARKGGNVFKNILLPTHAPIELYDREKLWGSLEEIEKNKRAQLCREITVALPKELELQEQIKLVQDYCLKNFVDKGMACDINIHDKGDGNPHAHIHLPMRAFDTSSKSIWASKQKKIYMLDESGKKIYDKEKKQYACRTEATNNWGNKENLINWRKSWAQEVNRSLERNNINESIDYRSYHERGIKDVIPQFHEGKKNHMVEETFSLKINQRIRECNIVGATIIKDIALIYKEYNKEEEERNRRR